MIRVGTRSDDPQTATFVANSQTTILTAQQIAGAVPTGSGVIVTLTPGTTPPVVGGAVALPISATLEGGYLGVVTSVSVDGRSVNLRAGSLDEAFDYYELSVGAFSGGNPDAGSELGSEDVTGSSADSAAASQSKAGGGKATAKTAANALGGLPCGLGGGGTNTISFAPAIKSSGHFSTKVDKFNLLGKDIPQGASFDMAFAMTVSAPATVKTTGALKCEFAPPKIYHQFSVYPVPLGALLTPTVSVGVGGAMEVSNVGVAATAGVSIQGHVGLTSGGSVSADPVLKAAPLTPKIVLSAGLTAKVGAQLIVGPGAGTSAEAGIIAGLSGEINPVDASFGPVWPIGDPRYNVCLRAAVDSSRNLGLTMKAWLHNWSYSQTFTLDALKFKQPYDGFPQYLPKGCKDAVQEPGDTVIGSGVTKIDDSVIGSDNQWGYLPGFVPGKKTWVLSTGRIADAVGEPATFASSDLGGAGDSDLTTFSGHETHDAVSYNVTVVPSGSRLHVRYAFASEEYPEYVGSSYNDVMAVFVNGVNCATVPGSSDPVSINTINAIQNSSLYVDNAEGASGYGTTMDGLTKPLECNVPVKVGQSTKVKITVADASDSAFDSAVVLLDEGIWSSN